VAPGYTDFAVDTFSSEQPIVGTYFFYWFDADTLRAHQEQFPYTPVDDQTQSFLDPASYQRQFSDMLDAGIDFSLINSQQRGPDHRSRQADLLCTIRDYFSRIPPQYWAAIDNRPIVWLYDAQRVAAFDQSTFDYVYAQFAADFGGLQPWIVREQQWYTSRTGGEPVVLHTEGVYAGSDVGPKNCCRGDLERAG
jgi:hypothetical protein